MNSVIKGKRGRPRKSIWDHFTEVSTSNNNNNEAGSSKKDLEPNAIIVNNNGLVEKVLI